MLVRCTLETVSVCGKKPEHGSRDWAREGTTLLETGLSWPDEMMESKPIDELERFCRAWSLESTDSARVAERFPFHASPFVMNLVQSPGDPIWRQIVPHVSEIEDCDGLEDPLSEESLSVVPNLVHRYPSRVLWLISTVCAAHCRFCTRKRRWGSPIVLTDALLKSGLDYIRSHVEVRDVLLSGGDPLLLPEGRLEAILASLRTIPHVEIIRIGTRAPAFSPQLIGPDFAAMLARYHPLYVNIHFNHPAEITPESVVACTHLANVGIPLGSQTVLLKDVNDDVEILAELFQGLLKLRVRPYYLMQMDLTRGTRHFRTPIHRGLEILHGLRNRISGLGMPHFVIDLPGGQGKVPLVPSYIQNVSSDQMVVKDWLGRACTYPLLPGEASALLPWLGTRSPSAGT
ncbi:MAG: KamA family radical SAM protein [Syntrophobacteraceae bacterium]